MVGHIEFFRPVSYWDAYELSYQLYGLADIYVARRNPENGWSDPRHLACARQDRTVSSTSKAPRMCRGTLVLLAQLGGRARWSLRRSAERRHELRAATPITELNDAGANDIQPNVRKTVARSSFPRTAPAASGEAESFWAAITQA
jgi:hypothetical protein